MSMEYLAAMLARWASTAGAVLSVTLLAACAGQAPLEPAAPGGWGMTRGLDQLSAPLEIQQADITRLEDYRAVFLKLSRLPGAVTHLADANPARITVDVQGPTRGGGSGEQKLKTDDDLIWQVRVSEHEGFVRVVLDLRAAEPPLYSVETLADWIMIRLQPPG
jgi:hypothetical protein